MLLLLFSFHVWTHRFAHCKCISLIDIVHSRAYIRKQCTFLTNQAVLPKHLRGRGILHHRFSICIYISVALVHSEIGRYAISALVFICMLNGLNVPHNWYTLAATIWTSNILAHFSHMNKFRFCSISDFFILCVFGGWVYFDISMTLLTLNDAVNVRFLLEQHAKFCVTIHFTRLKFVPNKINSNRGRIKSCSVEAKCCI